MMPGQQVAELSVPPPANLNVADGYVSCDLSGVSFGRHAMMEAAPIAAHLGVGNEKIDHKAGRASMSGM